MCRLTILLCLTLVTCLPAAVISAGFSATIQLGANPEAINADGKSVATISAEVRDSSGNLVADGTQVSFTTSLGTIEASVGTIAGVARATLHSGTTQGTAVVSAALPSGGAVAQRRVEFLPPGSVAKDRSYVAVSSDTYLVYSVDHKTLESVGGVRVSHRGTTIEADSAQLKLDTMELRARQRTGGDPVRIKKGNKMIEAGLVYYDLNTGKGVIVTTIDTGAARKTFSIATMETEEESADARADIFDFADLSDTAVFVKARRITVREGQDMQFRRAEIYVGEKKILSVPLHVSPLSSDSGLTGQILSVGSTGVRVDLPFYYSLSPSFMGSFRIRNQQAGGWGYYSSSPGWSLDLEQQYAAGLTGQGTFALTRITGGDWGARWTHSQDFMSGARIYSYLDFSAHRDLYGMLSLAKPLKGFSLGLNLNGGRYSGQSATMSSDLYLQTNPRPLLPNKLNYALSIRSSYRTTTALNASRLGNGLQLQLYGTPVKLGSATSISSSLSVGRNWGGSYSGQTILGTASLSQQLGSVGGLGLVYSYNKDLGFLSGLSGRHRLSGNLYLTPGSHWNASVFATYGLDDSTMSSFGDISYKLGGGWRLNALTTWQRFGSFDFSDLEFAVGKQIGTQEAMLVWSNSQKRFRVEFGALKF